mmetsp:Transcript_34962/g.104293  ORF Transcript_34962/g.104293 Transcript_34962/m.104293 type:complete len:83 (-) Transcript_34962:382-630(-)|eukprot:CAMPEP_0113527244 /NCGR_PEP_ID=MMETSP0015_2-20120614/1189_1 /TAXON_ID=2838 /ORGANISM="Odontella" /LENGTH=82 /DNA_ID=CAMNT_0000425659 /DNA_START=22 /DNA_END=270 /DNA_ORIENTATION=- /assembly_acc=CAM_ASM_000160
MTSPTAPIPLFRTLLREARKMNDYNFRSFAIRRVKTGFAANRDLQGEEASAALAEGQQQLEVLRRQVILGQLYPSGRSVMEV